MATWPDLTEYHEALQHPAKSFADAGLKQAKIELDRFGMPKPATGGNAVVYKASERAETWAVRCFLRPISDHAERYAAISRHLEKARLSYGARFLFLKDGILVRGNWFPVVKMAWVDGDLFHRYIEDHLKQPAVLAGLRGKWRTLVRELEAARLAHGDLQHGNILVRKDSLVLVDYDGMWVPALNGRSATEIGHRSYQHPKRSESDFGPYLDRFPALVIYLSLAALEHNPKLWDDYHTGDNLLFVRDDFRQAGKSALWQELAAIRSDEIAHLTGTLAACLEKSPSDVPDLESILKHSTRLKPKALPAGPPAGKAAPPSGLPAWLASGAASALPISDVARQWKIVWSRPGQRVETRWKAGTPAPAAVKPTHTRRSSGGGTKVAIIVIGLAIAAIVASQGATTPAGIIAGAAIVIALLSSGAPRSAAASDDDEGDSSAGRETFRVSTPGMKSKVFAIQASADGNEVAVVTQNGECGTWEVAHDSFRATTAKMPGFQIAAMAQNAPKAVVAGESEAAVWNLAQWLKTACPVDSSGKVESVALSPDGSQAALGYTRSLIDVVDVSRRNAVTKLKGHGGPVTAIAFSDDGHLISGSTAGSVHLSRPSKGEKVADGFIHTARISAVAAAPKGLFFASGDEQGAVTVWSPNLARVFSVPLSRAGIACICFVGQGEPVVAVGCNDGSVKILNVWTGRILANHQLGKAPVTALAPARKRPGLAAGTADGRVCLLAIS